MEILFNADGFKRATNHVLSIYKPNPFLCTFMSASLLELLEIEFPERTFNIKTGDLYFCSECLFKQDFDLNSQTATHHDEIIANWEGHCWVELENRYIIDISLFRTIYSDKFNKHCKADIISIFGNNRGLLVIDKFDKNIIDNFPFKYIERNVLSDLIINGLLKATEEYQLNYL
mgnify:CR=1 FL=1